jgi:glycosyltransferase involved in cell wall biosynthesis
MTITKPYTNFVSIPVIKNSEGKIFTDPLWAKDILLHLDYIDCFNLCCPVEMSDSIAGLVDITEYKINEIFPLKRDFGLASIIKNIFPNFLGVLKACKKSEIVHSGGAGWAFPLSYYILPLKPFFKFQWVIVIESSFWLMSENDKPTFRKVFSHFSNKYLLKLCVRLANARIFTQSFYKDLFLGDTTKNIMINPASWVNESNLVSLESVLDRNKSKDNKPIEFLFPARLIEEKGIRLLFETIQILAAKQIVASFTFIGEGHLKDEVIAFANKSNGSVKITYLEPVEYNTHFFRLIQDYDIVLVPNLKEEQPRIIFDAFSQGVGIIGSNTSGIMDIVTPDQNAYIFKAGDSQDFAEVLIKAIKKPQAVHDLGVKGLNYAYGKTHINMHKDRLKFLKSTLKLK